MNGYLAIELEMSKRRKQAESVRGKDTPFRVEFRYRGGTKHYQYFVDLASTAEAEDSLCLYGLAGLAQIERPRSQRVQVRGPKGGWKNHV